jgi:hypothetical protein
MIALQISCAKPLGWARQESACDVRDSTGFRLLFLRRIDAKLPWLVRSCVRTAQMSYKLRLSTC